MTGTQIAGIVIGIIGFLFLITIHEGGHCLVSKALGVRVNEFSVGMGPLIGQKEKNGTMYSLRLIPIGGYCALEGEFGEDMTDEEIENFVDTDPKAFVNQPFWKQFLILIAGSFVNFVFGFLLFIIVYSIVAAGRVGFARILEISWQDCFTMVKEIIAFIGGLFTGSSSVDDVSGVIGIISIVADSASYGLINVVYLVGLISVNLSIMNMLPIPGLDGGRIFVSIVKIISGGRLSQKAENIINGIGMALLLALIVLIAIKDVIKLF